jgi:hypothetical protein
MAMEFQGFHFIFIVKTVGMFFFRVHFNGKFELNLNEGLELQTL